MSNKYLDDDELTMLGELFQEQAGTPTLTLSITMDAALRPLLAEASALELKVELNGTVLSFPVQPGALPSLAEEAQLSPPDIVSAGHHPRAWRLPAPQGLSLRYRNGKPVAAEIRDLSVNGMKLLSQRPLFAGRQYRLVQLILGQEQKIPLKLCLVRQHRGNQFWLTTARFELAMAERLALSEFVFRGFLERMEQERP